MTEGTLRSWIAGDTLLTDQLVIELSSQLSAIAYDRLRDDIASKLDIRVPTLDRVARRQSGGDDTDHAGSSIVFDDVEPWSEVVDGESLLDDLVEVAERHVVLPPGAAVVVALWVVFTYLLDDAPVAPMLAITSPTKGCGKTTLLDLLGRLVRRPLIASNISSAAVFRSVEMFGPTLLIDEADSFLDDNNELRGIINSGHRRSSAFIVRCEGDSYTPRRFTTWCPKALAAIRGLPATISDRSLNIRLQRKNASEHVTRLPIDERTGPFGELRQRITRWVQDNRAGLLADEPEVPEQLGNRAADNWYTLIAIGAKAGPRWRRRAFETASRIEAVGDDDDISAMLLQDLESIWLPDEEKLTAAEVCTRLVALEERPWGGYRRGQPIDPRGLGRLIRSYGVESKDMRHGGRVLKGYVRATLEPLFERYNATTSSNSSVDQDLDTSERALDEVAVAQPRATGNESATAAPSSISIYGGELRGPGTAVAGQPGSGWGTSANEDVQLEIDPP